MRARSFACVALVTIPLLGAALLAARSFALLAVVNKSDATVALVDPWTRAVVATVPTGAGPHAIAADGALAFVANTASNKVTMVDLPA